MAADIYETHGGIAAGDYEIQFEFMLDHAIPSTYNIKQETIVEEEKK